MEAAEEAKASAEYRTEKKHLVEELSNEERDQNRQDQEDELLVLESILGDDFQTTEDAQRSLKSITISINVELAEPLGITASLTENDQGAAQIDGFGLDGPAECEDSGGGTRAVNGADASSSASSSDRNRSGSSGSHVQLPAVFVKFLPPIKLLCTLSGSYPSRSPPQFSLWTMWLSSSQISRLCKKLDEIWEQAAGQVVIFSWVDWLRQETLPFLEISHLLTLGPYYSLASAPHHHHHHQRDPRAVSEGQSIEDDIPRLLRYNEDRRLQEFLNGIHTCQICFSEMPGTEFLLLSCLHTFCLSCMRQHCALSVKEGTLNRLSCPDPACRNSSLAPDVLKQLLSPEDFQKWESMLLQRTLDTMRDLVYCPRCELPCIEDSDHLCQCAKCLYAFCGICLTAWHGSQQCLTPEARLRILQERAKGRLQGEAARLQEQSLQNEVQFLKYVRESAKQCPACNMAIQKSEGCNKMVCRNCGKYFCYKCLKIIKGYEHFRDDGCQLFDIDQVNAWNAQMMMGNFGGAGHPGNNDYNNNLIIILPARMRRCPGCAQPNLKEHGNNHIRCWACNRHFCGVCNSFVQKSSTHYGQKGKCKQHSAD